MFNYWNVKVVEYSFTLNDIEIELKIPKQDLLPFRDKKCFFMNILFYLDDIKKNKNINKKENYEIEVNLKD